MNTNGRTIPETPKNIIENNFSEFVINNFSEFVLNEVIHSNKYEW